jgi:hypothetical protein
MLHVTNAMFLVSAFVLILGIVTAVRAFLANRTGKAAPFRDYFGAEYDRELCRLSSFSETEDWRADCHSRFAPFRFRDPGANERR